LQKQKKEEEEEKKKEEAKLQHSRALSRTRTLEKEQCGWPIEAGSFVCPLLAVGFGVNFSFTRFLFLSLHLAIIRSDGIGDVYCAKAKSKLEEGFAGHKRLPSAPQISKLAIIIVLTTSLCRSDTASVLSCGFYSGRSHRDSRVRTFQ